MSISASSAIQKTENKERREEEELSLRKLLNKAHVKTGCNAACKGREK